MLALRAEGLEESRTAMTLAEQLDARESKRFGYSTFALIAESHISLHTFPEVGFFTLTSIPVRALTTTKPSPFLTRCL